MTIDELHIQLDLNADDKAHVLDEYASKCPNGYFFVDSESGKCYLFDEHGNLDDIKKIKKLGEKHIKKDVKKIVIPDGVTHIVEWAFFGCNRLTSMTIPNGMTSIGDAAFSSCISLASATIPDSVTSIRSWAFYKCNNLKSLIFKDKTMDQVKSIDNYPWGIEDESIIKVES